MLLGLSAAVTAMLGDVAAEIAIGKGVPEALVEPHEEMGIWTAVAIATWALIRALVWWRGIELEGRRVMGVVAVDAALVAVVMVTAYLGGQLVYDHAVNVSSIAG